MPTPARFKKSSPLARPASHFIFWARWSRATASSNKSGMPSSRAKPLPEPLGITPKAVSVPARPRAVSLMVPSPPMATAASNPARAASCASSVAWPGALVRRISAPGKLSCMAEAIEAILSASPFNLPLCGFKIKRMFIIFLPRPDFARPAGFLRARRKSARFSAFRCRFPPAWSPPKAQRT